MEMELVLDGFPKTEKTKVLRILKDTLGNLCSAHSDVRFPDGSLACSEPSSCLAMQNLTTKARFQRNEHLCERMPRTPISIRMRDPYSTEALAKAFRTACVAFESPTPGSAAAAEQMMEQVSIYREKAHDTNIWKWLFQIASKDHMSYRFFLMTETSTAIDRLLREYPKNKEEMRARATTFVNVVKSESLRELRPIVVPHDPKDPMMAAQIIMHHIGQDLERLIGSPELNLLRAKMRERRGR